MEQAITEARESILETQISHKPISTDEARVETLINRAFNDKEYGKREFHLNLVPSDDLKVHTYEQLRNSNERNTNLYMIPEDDVLFDVNHDASSMGKAKRIQPIQCPIKTCTQPIHFSDYLSHYFKVHNVNHFEYRELFTNEEFTVSFCPSVINLDDNYSLCLFLYAGKNGYEHLEPCRLGFCHTNTNLLDDKWKFHLPVLLMASRIPSRTPVEIVPDPYKRESKRWNARISALFEQQDFVFWLASLETKNLLYVNITISSTPKNGDKPIKRTKMMKVRRMNEPRDPLDFMDNDTNFLFVKGGEMCKLSGNLNDIVNLKVKLSERFERI